MRESITWAALFLVCGGIAFIGIRCGVIGIRGGSVDKRENAVAFWIAITMLISGACVSVAMFLRSAI